MPNNMRLYDGPECSVWMVLADNKLWLHARYFTDLKKSRNMRQILFIADSIFLKLAACGIPEVYCTANSQGSFRFNEFLGFKSVGRVIKGTHEIMKKEL